MVKFKKGIYEIWNKNFVVWGFIIFFCIIDLGLVYMCGIIWRFVPVKFKLGMCEIKIFGSEILWSVFGILVQDGLIQI